MSSIGTVHCKRKEKKCLLQELLEGEEMSSIGTVGRRRNVFYRNCSL